jgi:hypothetical protein
VVDFLRRHVAILVALVFAWLVYSDLNPDLGKKKAEAKIERFEIDELDLRMRGEGESLPSLVDPYRLAEDAAREAAIKAAAPGARGGKPAGGSGAPGAATAAGGSHPSYAGPPQPADAADAGRRLAGRLAPAGPRRDRLRAAPAGSARARHRGPGAGPGSGPGAGPGAREAGLLRPAPRIHAVAAGRRPARISGQTVEVGASLEGMDPEKPHACSPFVGPRR